VNKLGVCIGCGRALAEIAEWPVASDTRRRAIVEQARGRRRELRKAARSHKAPPA
jgi:predicted Fe-S protein YdhL (DUF1289 family)